MPRTHPKMLRTVRPRSVRGLRRGLLSVILLALGATVPAAGAQVPPEGCSLSGYDDRCEVWYAVYDEAGPSGFQSWYLRPHLQVNDSLAFVTGQFVRPQTGLDPFVTIAYEQATGNQAWVVRRDIAPDAEAYANDTAISPAGDALFVAGSESIGPASQRRTHGLLLAYEAATGKQLWEVRFEGDAGDDESFEAVAVSPDGSTIYAAGRTSPSQGDSAMIVAAFDAATGIERWRAAHDGPAGLSDRARDIAVSADGSRVYVAGVEDMFCCSEYHGDFITIAYDAEDAPGTPLWTSRYDGPNGAFDEPVALALAPDGELLYVAGTQDQDSMGSEDFATLAYEADSGDRVWVATFDGPGAGWDVADALAVSPTGDRVYVTGGATVTQADAGDTRASVQFDMASVAYDAATGARDWVSLSKLPGDLDARGRDVVVSPDGRRVYVTGYASHLSVAVIGGSDTVVDTPVDVLTVAYESSGGSPVWLGRFSSQPGGLAPERGGAIALGPDGRRVFVAGYLNRVVWDPTGERRTAWFGTLSYEA